MGPKEYFLRHSPQGIFHFGTKFYDVIRIDPDTSRFSLLRVNLIRSDRGLPFTRTSMLYRGFDYFFLISSVIQVFHVLAPFVNRGHRRQVEDDVRNGEVAACIVSNASFYNGSAASNVWIVGVLT